MNDATRANVFRQPEGANTPEGWNNLREAVEGVRSDLKATNIDKIGHEGKWAVRYPNGDRPANEADCTFMVCARNTILSMMDKIESLYAANFALCDLADGCDNEIPRLRAEIEDLAKTHDGHTANLQDQIDGLLTEVKLFREHAIRVSTDAAPEAEPKAIKRTPKRKTTAKDVAAITDPTPAPVTAESSPSED